MSQNSAERLKAYLAQLPPRAQALLIREFERALERGDDAAVATFVLAELRKIVRTDDQNVAPRVNDPQRQVFEPLEPYLAEAHAPVGPGQIRRSSLLPIWTWLAREGAPEAVRVFVAGLDAPTDKAAAVRAIQHSLIDAIASLLAEPDQRRAATRIGPASAMEDLPAISVVLKNVEALDGLAAKLPGHFRSFGDSQIALVMTALAIPALQTPQLLPFALRLLMKRLPSSWQIVRLAVHAAATDDASRVAAHPFGVAVPMAIEELSQSALLLRQNIKRGQFGTAGETIKLVHDGVRGLRTELDVRSDSPSGRSLAMLRVDMSDALKNVIDNVPGRVRRLLRQRPDKDVTAATRLDPSEIDETAALIDLVAVCRSFASELAISEVTLRTYSELQSYIEKTTEMLVESLRHCEPSARDFREQQARGAIRFCEVLFGHDYAVLMGRSADNALADGRKPARAV
jgi:hypothetical protein